MACEHEQNSDYYGSRQPGRTLDSNAGYEADTQHPPSGLMLGLPGLMRSAGIGARGNAPVRASTMQQMQRTHGNRAVQRALSTASFTAIQRSPDGDEEGTWPRWLSNFTNQLRGITGLVGKASDNAPAPVYGPVPPATPVFTSEPPVYGPVPPATMTSNSVPALGEIGHVAPMAGPINVRQPRAEYNAAGARITENEHTIPRGNMEAITTNPQTGIADYGDAQYTRDATVRMSRDTALNKTHGNRGGPTADNPRTAALKARASNGGSINYRADVFEASIENAKRARDATGAIDLTDEAIHRGVLGQDANLFDMQRPQQSADIVRDLGSHVENFDIAEYNGPTAGAEAAPPPTHVPDAPSTSGWRHALRPGGGVDRTMRGASYGFQFFSNLSRGQGLGEATTGALFGGFANNAIGRQMSPKGGLVDMGVNLANTGLQLLGAPEEVTTVTQTVADATPSSFGTSLASNAGRGLWNLGDGVINGDWSGLKQQGEGILRGKEGAPLQGYAAAGEAAYTLLSGDSEMLDKIVEENRSGKRGKLAQWGSQLGGWMYDQMNMSPQQFEKVKKDNPWIARMLD